MKRVIIFLLGLSLALPSLALSDDFSFKELNFQKNNPDKNYIENEVIVKYKKEKLDLKKPAGKMEAKNLEEKIETENSEKIDNLNISLIRSKKTTSELINELKENPNIEFVEPNYKKIPTALDINDFYFNDQWYLNNTGQNISGTAGTNDADIDAPEAWEFNPTLTNSNIVAVIDSGVKHDHLDLINNMWNGSISCKDENNISIIGGCPNHGWDFENNDNEPDDNDGHGTFVSGIIGAETGNTRGISGLSYNNKTKIMALRFGFDTFSEIKAINFAKNNGAKIINASFVGEDYSPIEKNAIDSFDGIFIAATGNGGADHLGDNNDLIPMYPASYTSSNIISVAATDQNDALSSFSNYGITSVDIAAPGENLVSTYNETTNSYAIADGTSGAAPIVAGVVAVFHQKNPDSSISEIKNAILNNGDQKDSLVGKIKSGRRINFYKAITTTPFQSPVHRFWSDTKQGHFYTSSEDEKNYIIANYDNNIWRYEGVAYNAYNSSTSGITPIYRFWSDTKQHHFYTASASEKNYVIANYNDNVWKYEGIAYYAYASSQPGTTPVYRFWSDTKQGHFYTASEDEKNSIIVTYPENVWEYERIAWYVPED